MKLKDTPTDWILPGVLLIPHAILLTAIWLEIANKETECSIDNVFSAAGSIAAIGGLILALKAYNNWKKPSLFDIKIKEQVRLISLVNEIKFATNRNFNRAKTITDNLKSSSTSRNDFISMNDNQEKYLDTKYPTITRPIKYEKYLEIIETPDALKDDFMAIYRACELFYRCYLTMMDEATSSIERIVKNVVQPEPERDFSLKVEKLQKLRDDVIDACETAKKTLRSDRDIF